MKPRDIKPFGDAAVLLRWNDAIDRETHKAVVFADDLINRTFASEVLETSPAYSSLAIYLQTDVNVMEFITELQKLTFPIQEVAKIQRRLFTIPVCYDEPLGKDIKTVAKFHQLTVEEVINLHIQPVYDVYFIGFLPGFPYLGGLHQQLYTPRKATPRKQIEAGAVGIGSAQTGIYPNASPGGWNIIGQTPLVLFDVSAPQPALLQAGDAVRFKAVSHEEFQEIKSQVQQNTYTVKKEVYNA